MTSHVDCLIVGGGPSGVSAALTARSVGLDALVLESEDSVGGRAGWIGDIVNLAGFSGPGHALAAMLQAQASVLDVLRETVVSIRATPKGFVVDGRNASFLTDRLIWAAGLRLRTLSDVFTDGDDGAGVNTLPLIAPNFAVLAAMPVIHVLGADRPLGTFLRAQPEVADRVQLFVLPNEGYKVEEVRRSLARDPVELTDLVGSSGTELMLRDADGLMIDLTSSEFPVCLNLGSTPNNLPIADIVALDADGYPVSTPPKGMQICGDAGSAASQRLSTAIGSGAAAALVHYYERQGAHGRSSA